MTSILAGQGVEKGDDGGDLRFGQQAIKLGNAHRFHRLGQSLSAAVVEIGWRGSNVSQAWNPEQHRLRRAERMENAVPLEKIATHIDALMTTDAAERFEYLIARQLHRGNRIGFASKPSVEAATRRNEGSFVCRDGIQQRSCIGLPPISIEELADSFGILPQFADGHFRAGCHGLAETTLSSLLERSDVSFPVQPKVQAHVKNRRRIERQRPTLCRVMVPGSGTISFDIVAG